MRCTTTHLKGLGGVGWFGNHFLVLVVAFLLFFGPSAVFLMDVMVFLLFFIVFLDACCLFAPCVFLLILLFSWFLLFLLFFSQNSSLNRLSWFLVATISHTFLHSALVSSSNL